MPLDLPGEVEQLTAVQKPVGVKLDWRKPRDSRVSHYTVHRRLIAPTTDSDIQIATTERSLYLDRAVVPGEYTYTVYACNRAGCGQEHEVDIVVT